jgi:hypothetical protein
MVDEIQKQREENKKVSRTGGTLGLAGAAGMALYSGLEHLMNYAGVKSQMLAHVFSTNEAVSENGRALYEAATRATLDIASGESLKGTAYFMATAMLAAGAYLYSRKK